VSEVDERPGRLEVLSDAECVELLQSHSLGRLALIDKQSRPLIFPVNYFFEDGIVAFRTAPGTKLDLAPGSFVSFEIDDWDPGHGVGWSVLARGLARDITEPRGSPSARIRYWPVQPLAPGSRRHWIGVWVEEITGRKFESAEPDSPEQADLEMLSEDDCMRLLQSQSLGRVAIVVDGRPQILPVNYIFDQGVVVFRTAAGLKLARGPLRQVAFEIDRVDFQNRVAWSVMVQGTAQRITDTIDSRSERLRRLPVKPAAPGTRLEWLAIYSDHISGRRFKLPRT